MMENITLEFIGEFIAFIAALVGGLGYLNKTLKKWLTKLIVDQQNEINTKLDAMSKQLTRVDIESTKNFLVRCIADFENNTEISETELERFWEQYGHYIDAGGNTYIKERVEKLKKEGIL